MEQVSLTVEIRETKGKGISRRLRRAGKLPGVLYGLGKSAMIVTEPIPVKNLLLSEGGRNKMLNLKGSGVDGRIALIRDFQIDPLSRVLLHVDLLEIDVTKKINVTVKINFTGKAAGVADGGVLNVIARQVEVFCLPNNIPAHIDVDVTALTIGDSIHLDAVALPEGVEKAGSANPTIVACVPPTKEEEAVASLAPSAEPEVITEKKAEGAEGAAAAGGDKDKGAAAKKDEKKK